MINKILLATDGSENALRAAKQVADLMKLKSGLETTVLYARSSASKTVEYAPWVQVDEIEKQMEKFASRAIDKTAVVFTENGFTVEKKVVIGEPGTEIATYANKNGFDWIVMGRRGLSNLSGLILGSVSHQVLHYADCPVLLVK